MPEVTIVIAGREFRVACEEGEEHFLQSAAELLDSQATELSERMGRLPEERMLLMAGLILADKTAELGESQRNLKEKVANLERKLTELRTAPKTAPEEAGTAPGNMTGTLAEIAGRAEALADRLEKNSG